MATCACGNEPRYVDAHGKLVCGLCPIQEGVDSIRISQIPALLAFARGVIAQQRDAGPEAFGVIVNAEILAELIA